MKAIFTLLATTAVAAATTLSGRTGQESAPAAPTVASTPMPSGDLFGSVAPAPATAQVPIHLGDPVTAPAPVHRSLFAAQAAPAAPPRGVPILEDLPVIGRLFSPEEAAAAAQDPMTAPQPTRARRRAASADDERAAELDRLKARLAELEQQLAERERGETQRVRTRNRSAEGDKERVEEVMERAGEQANRERARIMTQQGAAVDEATLDAARRAHTEALAAQEKDHANVRELVEHARAEAMNAAERARAEARVFEEHARAQALDARALAEHARRDAEEARAHAEHSRAQADELRAQVERAVAEAREGARVSLQGLGYVDTTPEVAEGGSEWRRLDRDVQELARKLEGFEEGQLQSARGQLEKARVQLEGQLLGAQVRSDAQVRLEGQMIEGTVVDPSAAPTAPRLARTRVMRPDSQAAKVHAEQAEVLDPSPPVARVRARTPRPDVAPMPPAAPDHPTPPTPPAAPSAPHAVTAPVAPMPGVPSAPGRAGTLRSRSVGQPPQAAAGQPGMPSGSGAGPGGAININVENGDVHIHNGGGGAQISVNGADPFSVDTTQPRGDKDRLSGAFPRRAENEEATRTQSSTTFGRSFGVGDLRESSSGDVWQVVSPPADANTYYLGLPEADAVQSPGEPAAGFYYSVVNGAVATWTPEQIAEVQQLYAGRVSQTADETPFQAVSNKWLQLATARGGVQASGAEGQPAAPFVNVLGSMPGAAPAPEGALEELLRLVREVHADVRAIRAEMQTLRSEVEEAPPMGTGAGSFRRSAPGAPGVSGMGTSFGSSGGGGAFAPSSGSGSAGLGGAR